MNSEDSMQLDDWDSDRTVIKALVKLALATELYISLILEPSKLIAGEYYHTESERLLATLKPSQQFLHIVRRIVLEAERLKECYADVEVHEVLEVLDNELVRPRLKDRVLFGKGM